MKVKCITWNCPVEDYELPTIPDDATNASPRNVYLVYAACPQCHQPRDPKAYNTIQNRCVDCHQPIEIGFERCRVHYHAHWRQLHKKPKKL